MRASVVGLLFRQHKKSGSRPVNSKTSLRYTSDWPKVGRTSQAGTILSSVLMNVDGHLMNMDDGHVPGRPPALWDQWHLTSLAGHQDTPL